MERMGMVMVDAVLSFLKNSTGTILIAAGMWLLGFGCGWKTNGDRWEKKLLERENAAAAAVSETEKSLRGENEKLRKQFNESEKERDKKISDLRNAVAGGRLRLQSNGVRCRGNSSAGTGTEGGELDPAVANALLDITADGDRAIRELNYCIAAYGSVRRKMAREK